MADEDTHGGENQPTTSQQSVDATPQGGAGDDVQAQLARAQAELAKLKDEAAKRRISEREATKTAEEKALQAGRLQEALDLRSARLEELEREKEELAQRAAFGEAFADDIAHRVKALKEREAPKAVLDELEAAKGSPKDQLRILRVYEAMQATAPASKFPANAPSGEPGASPPPATGTNVDQMIAEGASLEDIFNNPEAVAALSKNGSASKPSTFSIAGIQSWLGKSGQQ